MCHLQENNVTLCRKENMCNAFALIIFSSRIEEYFHGDMISVTERPQMVGFICSEMAKRIS
jgi:hypothetical protein